MVRVRFVFTIIVTTLLIGTLCLLRVQAIGGRARSMNDSTRRTPVLVELFTSEGCSDCPPADALLERLDRSQPVSGADLIVLSEHVDYWNNIGWKDPFSSPQFSERQGTYASQFRLDSVYTPQMVVDGRIQLVGSDERGAIRAIGIAAKAEKIPVRLSSIHFEGKKIALHLDTGPSPSSAAESFPIVLLAIADENDQSNVSNGENAGRTLSHVAVLRDLVRVGALDRAGNFSQDVAINFNRDNNRNLRIVAIVQEPTTGRVLGVGSARLSN